MENGEKSRLAPGATFRPSIASFLCVPSVEKQAGEVYPAIAFGNNAMIDDTIGKIETKIQNADTIKEDRRRELLDLLGTLKSEVAQLSETHGEEAQSIAGFTEVSAHEATRTEQNPELLKLSLEGLTSSVQGFESSHPRLVHIVNAISSTLANLGDIAGVVIIWPGRSLASPLVALSMI